MHATLHPASPARSTTSRIARPGAPRGFGKVPRAPWSDRRRPTAARVDNAGSTSGHQEIAERTADTPPRAPDSVVQPVPQPRDPVGTGLRVLLAEDDTMVARSTMALLRRLGHTPTHAVDGMSAWECLKVGLCDFDVLLLDMVMPRMTGSDLAYRARAAGFAGRIVLFSGLIMHVDPEALGLLGIRDFMTKPFLPSELERVLRAGDGVA